MKSPWMRWVRDESGQVLVLFALLITVIFGFAALAIDVGGMVVEKSKVQNAADAAALAAAQDLPETETGVVNQTATTYAEENGAVVSDIDTVYEGDPNKVEVVCTKEYSYTFARVFPGFDNVSLSASAVAQKKGFTGETVPFINFDPYEKGEDITIWDKEGSGNFERLYVLKKAPNWPIYDFDPEVGAIHDNGKVSDIKDAIEPLLPVGATVYLLSLSNDIMKPGETIPTTKKNGNPDSFVWPDGNVGQESIIGSEYLVLLKCKVLDYDGKTMKFNIEDVYEDLTPAGLESIGTSAKLIR